MSDSRPNYAAMFEKQVIPLIEQYFDPNRRVFYCPRRDQLLVEHLSSIAGLPIFQYETSTNRVGFISPVDMNELEFVGWMEQEDKETK